MKKIILSFLGLIIATGISFGQDFKLGIKAGANFSKLKSEEKWLNSENNTGYLIGAWGRIGAGVIHLQPEAYFTSKHTTIHIEPDDTVPSLVSGDLKFSNIDVPILLGTRFPVGPIKARVQAGPLFSFVMNNEASYEDNISASYEEALKNYKDKFSAVVVGGGLDFSNFTIDVRYEYGLGNISKSDNQKQTLNIWTVSLGYSFF